MAVAELLISPQQQFVDASGTPYAFGKLHTYIEGTFTPKPTYQDRNQATLNPNPITLDVRGTCIVFGTGTYRFILNDADGNQIFDALSDEPLPASAVSDAMLPVLGAATLAQARTLMGIDAEIAAAVGNIDLMPGPTGPAGPQGAQGVTGPTGAAGAAGTLNYVTGNPAYVVFGQYGVAPILQWGFAVSDVTGHGSATFGIPFPNTCTAVVTSVNAPDYWWSNVSASNNGGFSFVTTSPSVGGTWFGGPIGVSWSAFGF